MRRRPGLLLFTCIATLVATGLWLPLKAMLARDLPPPGWPGDQARASQPAAFAQPAPVRARDDDSCAEVLPAPGTTDIAVTVQPEAESQDTVARL